MLEKDFQIKFGHYIKSLSKKERLNTGWELKICKEKRFNFGKIEKHQLVALKQTKDNGLYYKISDQSMGQKPYDCFFLRGRAYVVILWYKERQDSYFYFMEIDCVLGLMDDGKKSITEQDAEKYCDKKVLLK